MAEFDPRYSYFELHAHTNKSSDCWKKRDLTVRNMAVQAKKRGLRGFALTEHNNILSALEWMDVAEELGLTAILGTEITTMPFLTRNSPIGVRSMHMILLGLDARHLIEHRYRLPTFKDPLEVSAWGRAHGAKIVAPHGYEPPPGKPKGVTSFSHDEIRYLAEKRAIDAIETTLWYGDDQKLRKIAEECNLPCIGASDSHELEQLGIATTGVPHHMANNQYDVLQAILQGQSVTHMSDDRPAHSGQIFGDHLLGRLANKAIVLLR